MIRLKFDAVAIVIRFAIVAELCFHIHRFTAAKARVDFSNSFIALKTTCIFYYTAIFLGNATSFTDKPFDAIPHSSNSFVGARATGDFVARSTGLFVSNVLDRAAVAIRAVLYRTNRLPAADNFDILSIR